MNTTTTLLPKALSRVQTVRNVATKEMFVGGNIKMRPQLSQHMLSDIRVAVLHDNSKAALVCKILADHGASIKEFSLKGSSKPSTDSHREIDLQTPEESRYLENCLKNSDVFLTAFDIDSLSKMGFDSELAAKRYPQLIVAKSNDDALSAMNVVKNIAIGLYLRQKYDGGQVIRENGSSEKNIEELKKLEKTLRK